MSIWKDPKVELPESYKLNDIASPSLFIVHKNGCFSTVEYIEGTFIDYDFENDYKKYEVDCGDILKWAYCSDLIKQAQEK